MRRLIWAGPLTVAASTIAVVIVQFTVTALLHPPSPFSSLVSNQRQLGILTDTNEPAIFTFVLVSVAVIVFAVLCRESTSPARTFRRVAFVALIVSLIPDILAPMGSLFGWPTAIVFMVMHVVAWAICVNMLVRLVPITAE